ncbi:MAG: hypothetical protein II863_01985 [Kiritimatiellae bacterium]|nr:hypothetical protein [Kiritimatiellia bacterium]
MSDNWRDIDLALIIEATKVHPDFAKLEQLVKDGADVNAVENDGEENALSDIIYGGQDTEDYGRELPKVDSLPAVIEFFLKHGFDPSRDEGRAGAKCLVSLTWSRCIASKIPSMKLLLDAGCRDIPAWDDEHDPDDGKPKSCIGAEASFQHCEGDFDCANTFEALYDILVAQAAGRSYAGIERYDAAYGATLKHVFVSKPREGTPFFKMNEPTSKHDNCFRGSLYLEFDKGWLISEGAHSLVFDTEPPHEAIIDVSYAFSPVVNTPLSNVVFSQKSVSYGMTYYGQNIIRYNFRDDVRLITQTNFGEIRGSETVAYYKLENEKGSVDAK